MTDVTAATAHLTSLEVPRVPTKKTVQELMNQSTIYRRHQARTMKSMEKRDDPRPAVVRVLSGLPGFRTFIPPYDASSAMRVDTSSVATATETEKEMIFPTRNHASHAASFLESQPLHVLFTAGVAGAVAEACYGGTTTKKTQLLSPFRTAAANANTTTFVQQHGANLSIFRLASSSSTSSMMPSSSSGAATKAQLLAGASTASVLFGAKALASSFTTASDNPLASLASSAVAGCAVAGVSALQSTEARFLQTAMQQQSIPRHIAGATLYFGSYDAFKGMFCGENKSAPSVAVVSISGAVAGALYQTALLHGSTATIVPSSLMLPAPRMVPAVLKAAPAHALLFVGYEWVQGNLPPTQRQQQQQR